jgi:hypothetical protein
VRLAAESDAPGTDGQQDANRTALHERIQALAREFNRYAQRTGRDYAYASALYAAALRARAQDE